MSKITDDALESLYSSGSEGIEIERSAIEFVLRANDNAVTLEASDLMIDPTHFTNVHYGAVWGQIAELADSGNPINMTTVYAALLDAKSEAIECWPNLFASLPPCVPKAWVLPYLAWLSVRIRKAHYARETVRAAQDYAEGVVAKDWQAQREARQRLEECEAMAEVTEALEADAAVLKCIDFLQKNSENTKDMIPTGLNDIDLATTGFQKGELWIIGARPSQGKTALALNMFDAASSTVKCHFISLEMTLEQLVARWNVMHSGIPMNKMITGKGFSKGDQAALISAFNKIRHHFAAINDNQRLGEIRTLRTEIISGVKKGAKVIFVDYLQLITAREAKERRLEMDMITRTLKRLAMQFEISIVALAQLNRGADGKRPQMGDLKESSGIEQDADKIILIDRPYKGSCELGEPEQAFLILEKQRNGVTGEFPVMFDPVRMRFTTSHHNRS
jgi:replicative DNA helicase